MSRIRLAIADDEQLFVELMVGYFGTLSQLETVCACHSGEALLHYLQTASQLPDLVLLDLRMKGMDGTDTLASIRQQFAALRVIVLSSHYKRSFMGFMLKSGANAFIPKDLKPSELVHIIDQVHRNGHYFMPDQVEVLAEQLSTRIPKPAFEAEDLLSDREKEVLRLLCQQLTAREIGEKLFVTQRTVESHKDSILSKTGMRNTAGLVVYAVKNGVIDLDDLPLI